MRRRAGRGNGPPKHQLSEELQREGRRKASEYLAANKPKIWTREEHEAQMQMVSELLAQFHNTRAIVRAMQQAHGVGHLRTKKLIVKVREQWAAESIGARQQEREQQTQAAKADIARLTNRILQEERLATQQNRVARVTGLYAQKIRLQEHLAQLTGAYLPLEVDLVVQAHVQVSQALLHSFANLSPEDMQEMVQESLEEEAAAEAWRKQQEGEHPMLNGKPDGNAE